MTAIEPPFKATDVLYARIADARRSIESATSDKARFEEMAQRERDNIAWYLSQIDELQRAIDVLDPPRSTAQAA